MQIKLDVPKTARAEHLDEIAALLRAVFPKERSWEHELPWQYLDNPCGPAWYVNARTEHGELVGHYSLIPAPPLADRALGTLRTFLSLNTAVHPKAQGKGIFKSTAKALFEHLESLHPSVVLGVANANSIKGFLSSLGFSTLGQLTLAFFPPWRPPQPQGERVLEASQAFLSWRAARPGSHVFRDAQRGLLTRTLRHRGVPMSAVLTTGMAAERLPPVPERGAVARLAHPLLYATSVEGSSGGVAVPRRLRPSPLHFIYRVLPANRSDEVARFLQGRRFEFVDFDVV